MRARIYTNGGNMTGGFTFSGGVMTGALLLAGNPSEALEAAAKQYVDSSLVNLNASNVSTGILPTARLPSFAGDLVKPAGSSTINLAPTGVTAGDFIKPTIDEKGRVVGGGVLTEADIPNMSWNKVSINRPDTLAEYGITDGVSLSGGILSGFLTYNGTVTQTLQAVNKQYVDITLSNATGIAIGDIIRKPYTTTPPGFLKCNGAEVDKTTFNTLYSVIGDRFNKQKHVGAGRPWEQQYQINSTQSADITGWSATTSLPGVKSHSPPIVTKNRVYLFGGGIGTNSNVTTSAVYTAPINSDGTLGAWTTGTSLPASLGAMSAIVTKNRVYLLGGSNGIVAVSTVYTAQINSDGTLGTWTTGTALPIGLYNAQYIVTKNRVYLLGGYTGTAAVSTVYTAPINIDGTLGTWTTGISLPVASYGAHVIVTKNRVYLLGGHNGTTYVSTVYTATINSDGGLGPWTSAASLPSLVYLGGLFITSNRVYLFGGLNGTRTSKIVYTTNINADGTLVGTWTVGTSIPIPLYGPSTIVTSGKVYLCGGTSNGAALNTVYTAPILGGMNDYSSYYAEDTTNYMMPGSGKPWEQQYQINSLQSTDITSWITTTSLPSILAASQAIVTKNRVYLCGGHTSNNTFTSTVYTAPINADGTLGTWTTGTSLPGDLTDSQIVVTKNRVYLLGGLNGSSYISTVYTAPINSDGTLGTWLIGTSLPTSLGHSQAIVTKNRVYLLGGGGGSYGISPVSTIYTAPINSDGTLGTWSSSGSIPQTKWAAKAFITKNRVYLCGGWNGVSLNTVHSATINSDGLIGIWETEANLPVALANSAIVVFNKKVFILGSGTVSTGSAISTVYVADIFPDGTLGSWTTSVSLPDVTCYTTPIITKNHIYLCGRSNGQTAFSSVYMANILGGENDYSPYYDGTVTPIIPVDHSTVFTLPDLINNEKFDTVSYIKY